MFSSIWDDLKREYEYGNMISRLIIINVSIFFVFNIIYFFFYIFTQGKGTLGYEFFVNSNLCMSAYWQEIIWKPWTIISHFFLHFDFSHILWNMVGLYFFGSIFGDLLGDQRVLPLYILGGLAGGLAFFLSHMFLPNIGSYALGASASIMSIVVAAGLKAPNYLVRLIILGEVKLKYIVLVMLLLDMIGARSLGNSGGHFAHLGGALMGYIFISNLNNGTDMAVPVNRILDAIINFYKRIFKRGGSTATQSRSSNAPRRERTPRTNSNTSLDQQKVDNILEKIKETGYDSLSDEEKQVLFNASRSNK